MYIPEGYGTMFPYIVASEAIAYLDFLKQAFGATELGRTVLPDRRVANVRVRIGTTSFMLSEAGHDSQPTRSAFYLYVEDVDASYRRALECGAEDLFAPQDMPYGDRQGGVKDPAGNIWWVSTRTKRVPYDATVVKLRNRSVLR